MKKLLVALFGFILLFGCLGIGGNKTATDVSKLLSGKKGPPMELKTTSFLVGGGIPMKYTCEGQNINPELKFENAPREALTFAVILEDKNSNPSGFTHWLVWNIANKTKEIKMDSVDSVQGKNDFGKSNYNGPCPPSEEAHKYRFKGYALDVELNLNDDSTRKDLENAMNGHILAQAEMEGTYKLQK